ncbi:TPR-like protein [Mollisia scopiformis]|uniref:TPR-like protein n=1 Tax=Mollisia scopiformis TaxID=149040 RepID=A0A194X5G1_MOLSC|nr:TPR-like protein [Mollisia scopiformis]KUJ15052.1 TPR-like protein [Mollisia scopiformis]
MQLRTTRDQALPCKIIPYPENPRSRGRVDTLQLIESHLSNAKSGQSSLALHGMGGVGKTQLALKYIYNNWDNYPVILWVQAAKLSESYITAAKQLNLVPEDSDKDANAIATILKNWLGETSEKWLIVYDNADDIEVLKPYWPPGNKGGILITSRNAGAARVAGSGAHTEDSDPEDHDPELVSECVKLLGYLPLAIAQIYESLYQGGKAIYNLSTSTVNLFYEHTLMTVWRISITRLSQEASRLLEILVYFDPDTIPDQLFLEGAKNNPGLEFLSGRLSYLDAVSELLRQGLVMTTRSKKGSTPGKFARGLSVHRLVQESVFYQLDAQGRSERFKDALTVLVGAWPTNAKNPFRMNALWSTCALYLPHVVTLEARYRESSTIEPPPHMIRLIFLASWYMYERRMSEFARPLLDTALNICARGGNVDPFYPKVLTTYGCIKFEMGHVDSGISDCTKVVDLYQQREKPRDFLKATALSDLGWMYVDKGDLPKAIELYQKGLEIANEIDNEAERLDWSVHIGHSLSRAYIELEQPEKALELQFSHGDEFACGLISECSQRGALFLYGIGNAHLSLGRKKGIEGAEERRKGLEYHMRALKARNKVCGDHYITAISLHKVGVVMHEIGKLEAAESTLERAARILRNEFAADGERSRTLYHLSLVKSNLGKDNEAAQLLTDAWQHREKLKGEARNHINEKDTAGFDKMVIYFHN